MYSNASYPKIQRESKSGRHPNHWPAAAICRKRQCPVDAARVPRASPSPRDVTCTPFIHVSLIFYPTSQSQTLFHSSLSRTRSSAGSPWPAHLVVHPQSSPLSVGTLDLGSWRSMLHVDLRLIPSALALSGARPSRLILSAWPSKMGAWRLHWEVRRILYLGSSICTGSIICLVRAKCNRKKIRDTPQSFLWNESPRLLAPPCSSKGKNRSRR